ncbi:DNA repair ATPase [Mycolicibacterium acapulense]|nr:DNA repair ATPase [Mycolicibacterium acapulense]KUH98612.1 DNA repair ATPase [Mycolicibacterium acapulense]KUI18351.1 DNA repair ATPase [Mycolicibacterium acapulense]
MTTSQPGGQSSSPKPAPRPGPPRPGPVPRPGRPGPTVAVPPTSDPHRFGRVDPDGTVWLITGSGERIIGSWQAGDTEAAYAHFGRRFDDLQTEVVLMESRLESGTGDARKIKAAAQSLAETLPTAHVLGDVDAIAERLQAIVDHADETAQAEKARREELRAAQTARKEALAAEAEDIAANSTQWKAAGDRLREILDEWRTITGLDRKTDDALWKRYSAAREQFNRRRGSHFAELDRERAGARQAKEALCERAEELADSTDWGPTSAAFRELLNEWKAAGRAAKDVDDALWQRFKAAQDKFFGARNAASAERDAEFRANAQAKEALLAEAEKIDTSDLDAARAALRVIGDKWDAIGKVPRERGAELERRLRAIEKKVREAPTHGVDPEAQARADQFRVRAEQYERQAEKAAAAGRDKDAAEARASAEQWRQWADAAAEALGKTS